MAHETGNKQVETVIGDEIHDHRHRVSDQDPRDQLDPMVLCLVLGLGNDLGEFAIGEFLVADDFLTRAGRHPRDLFNADHVQGGLVGMGEAQGRIQSFETRVSEIAPADRNTHVVTVSELHPVQDAILGRLGSLSVFLLAATFVPFLVFFMLAAKRQVWHATMQLFPASQRTEVKETLADVTQVLRSYLVGTSLVGLILVLASWLFFWALGLDFPFLAGLVSGICNLIPYIGAVLSWAPPLLIGIQRFHTIGSYLGIFAVLTLFHIVAANLLIPALIGWRVRLNALALTVSLLFWGWMWGAMGLILAIPITAVLKVICDHLEDWQPVGRWLSA